MNNERIVVNSNQIISDFGENIKDIKLLRKHTESNFLTDKGYITVENTNNGQVTNIKLEGKTTLNPRIEVKGLFDYLEPIPIPYELKPSTTYTFFIRNNSGIWLTLRTNSELFTEASQQDTIDYEHPLIFSDTTKEVISNEPILIHGGDGIINTDFTLIILEGDHSQQPASYFEGPKSVGDGGLEILSRKEDGNLFDGKLVVGDIDIYNGQVHIPGGGDHAISLNRIEVESLTQYYLTFTPIETPLWSSVFEYDTNDNFIGMTDVAHEFVTQPNTRYIRFKIQGELNVNMNDVCLIEEGSISRDHKLTRKQILYKNQDGNYDTVVLRGVNNVNDSIEKHSDGKYYYHKRCRELVFDGSDDEGWHNIPYFDGSSVKFYIIAIDGGTIDATSCNLMTNIFNAFPTDDSREFNKNNNLEGAYWGDNTSSILQVHISNTKASSVENFKTWLSKNPMTVVYQLATEEVYECTNIDLDCFEGETSVICNSIIPPSNMSFKIANHISNTVEVMKDRICDAENKIIEMLNPNAMQSLGTTGYKVLSNGLILQWGEITKTGEEAKTHESWNVFPFAFPNKVLNITATFNSASSDTNPRGGYGYINPDGLNQFHVRYSSEGMPHSDSIDKTIVRWFAIGY